VPRCKEGRMTTTARTCLTFAELARVLGHRRRALGRGAHRSARLRMR
jgi:hypothetical protein